MRRVPPGVWWRSLGCKHYSPTHSWKRRWAEEEEQIVVSRRAFHWQPVSSTKKIASIAARSGTRGLWHPNGGAGRAGTNLCILAHSASGKRQPSSRTHRFGVLRTTLFSITQRWVSQGIVPTGIGT